jgi:hypothetical protein
MEISKLEQSFESGGRVPNVAATTPLRWLASPEQFICSLELHTSLLGLLNFDIVEVIDSILNPVMLLILKFGTSEVDWILGTNLQNTEQSKYPSWCEKLNPILLSSMCILKMLYFGQLTPFMPSSHILTK